MVKAPLQPYKTGDFMDIREITWGDGDYARAVVLRNDVLSLPRGRTIFDFDFKTEKTQLHFAAFDGERVVGSLTLMPEDAGQCHMRQVAVDPAMRGTGIGKALVEYAESEAKRRGYTEITLDSRDGALGFYQRLGYRICGVPRKPAPDLTLTPMCRQL